MLKLLNFRVLLLSTLLLASVFVSEVKSQVETIDYQIKYNTETCLWDFCIIIVEGSATTIPQRAQFNAQFSFLVPTGTSVANPIGVNPIQNNQVPGTGTVPAMWSFGTPAINPAAMPGFDFYPVSPTLAPASFFNVLSQGDTVTIFSIDIGIMPNCGDAIRPFINGQDPGSSAPGMGGGNFSNGYTLGSPIQLYRQNAPTAQPPAPTVDLVNLCTNNGIQIDAMAGTSTCQEPLTYQWSGPNGYTSSSEDVDRPTATVADAGTYTVTVTDAFGCETIVSIEGEVKPDAGEDLEGCVDGTVNLQGNPTTGTWASDPTNTGGGTLNTGTAGAATVDFDASASGVYTYIYTGIECSDSVDVTIVTPNAGDDPAPLACFSSGTVTVAATGTGTWSVGPGSAGTATITNPTSNNTTVTNFSAPGTYLLVWDVGGCTDIVTIVTNDNCDCAISNNALDPADPNAYCGSTSNVTLTGGAVSASGAYLWQSNLNGAPFADAAGVNNTQDYTTGTLGEGVHNFRRIYTTDNGIICADTSNTVSITVTEGPAVTPGITAVPQTVCVGETSTVTIDNTPGAVYLWTVTPSAGSGANINGSNTITLTPTQPGVYTVSATVNINGCEFPGNSIDINVNEQPGTPTNAMISSTDPTACAAADGTITLSGYNANTDYTVTYTFMGADSSPSITANGAGELVISGLLAGSYSNFSVTSSEGCASGTFAGPVVLSDPAAPANPTGLMASPNPECLGLPITISVDDIPGGTFNWSAPSPNAGLGASTTNTVEMNATAPGIYNVFVSVTVNGCTSIDTFTSIQVNDAPPAPNAGTVAGTDPTACGGTDGFITLSGYDASTTYDVTYSDNGVPTTVTINSNSTGVLRISNLSEGTYSDFFVTNFTGCDSGTFPGPVSLADPGSPTAPANLTANPNPVCLGNQVTVSVDNTIGATFNWSASAPEAGLGTSSGNSITMFPTATGTYTINVSVTLAGCTSMSSSIEVVVGDTPATPSMAMGSDPTTCGGTDGAIVISGYDAGENYTLTYSTGGFTQMESLTADAGGDLILTGLSAGSYSDFVVTNVANCPSDNFAGPISLVDPAAPPAPTGLAAMPNPLCQGETVSITADLTAGATYTWSISPSDAGFNPNNTNEISFTPQGNGIFIVTVVQTIAGCTSSSSAPINIIVSPSPDTPTAGDVTSTDPSGCGISDGTISIAGYNPGVSYNVQLDSAMVTINQVVTANSSGVLTFTGLASGGYTNIIITNDNNCSSQVFPGPVTLTDPGAPSAPIGLIADPNPSCLGTIVTLSVTDTPDAEYMWSAADANAGLVSSTTSGTTMSATAAGTYNIFVSQTIAGCQSPSAMIEVVVSGIPPDLSGDNMTGLDPTSCTVDNGSITITGLTANESYTLSYSVNGASTTVNVTADAGGEVVLSDLGAGSYTDFSLENTAGCASNVFAGPITLTQPGAPTAPTVVGTDPTACGLDDGSITLGGFGANESNTISYNFNGASTTIVETSDAVGEIILTGLAAGEYSDFSYVSAEGCTSEVFAGPIVLTEPGAPLAPVVSGEDPTACGEANGSITVGGLTPNESSTVTYSFNGAPTTVTQTADGAGEIVITDLAAGDYTDVTYVNASGCTSEVFLGPLSLVEPGAPSAPTNLNAVPNPVCVGEVVSLSVDEVAGATYTWSASSAGAGLISSAGATTTMTATAGATYTVSVSLTIAGCQSAPISIDVVVNEPPVTPSDLSIATTDPTSCATDDGTITLSGYGPSSEYDISYSYNGGLPVIITVSTNGAGEIVLADLAAGSYTGFTVTNIDGCSSGTYTGTVSLTQPGAPSAPGNLIASPNPVCLGNEVSLSVIDNPSASYLWTVSDPAGNLTAGSGNTATMNPSLAGTYTVTVTQTISGCTSPPSTVDVLVLEHCLNPDFGVTYNNIELDGDLSTNDNIVAGTTYGDPVALPGNTNLSTPTVNPDGTYTFLTSSVGEWYFNVEVCRPGSTGSCQRVPLAITVLDVESTENPPVGNHDYVATTMNSNISIEILANDECQSFPNCSIELGGIISGPFGGTYSVSSGTYSPNTNFVGRDSFLYEVCQSPSTPQSCDQEWVYIEVFPGFADGFTNAMDDYGQTPLNTVLVTDASDGLLTNDEDPRGLSQVVTPSSLTATGRGTITINSDGSYEFTPELDFIGPVDFEYTVCRSNDNTICDRATLHILVEPMAATGAVGACVWEDLNGNGILEPGEPGIEGVTVSLFNGDGEFVDETVTNALGNYQFDDVLQGLYFLQFDTIGEYQFTVPNVGNETNDSDVDDSFGFGTTSLISVSAGESIENIKAGMFLCTRIGDNVWYDFNKNDVYDPTENGINGMHVILWRRVGGAWVQWDETTTGKKPNSPSDDGWYEFCTSPGEYHVQVILPPTGLVQAVPFVGNDADRDSDINNANGRGTTSTFTLGNGQHKLDLGAGYYPQAEVGNLVWYDENFDGIQNPGESRMAGVLVQAYDANSHTMIGEAVTDDDGVYMIDSLDKRDIYLKFTPPAGLVATVADVGTDAIDSDVDHSYGLNTTRMFSIVPESTNNNVDFGVAQGALPVRWLDVTVDNRDQDRKIEWLVEQEVSVDYYIVLRRHESESAFTELNAEPIIANNISAKSSYAFIDEDRLSGGLYYYRIKQVDFDGKYNYSKIVSTKVKGSEIAQLFPNPTSGISTLSYNAVYDGTLTVRISDLNGKLLRNLTYQVTEGEGDISLDITGFTPGAYQVSIMLDDQVENVRLILIK